MAEKEKYQTSYSFAPGQCPIPSESLMHCFNKNVLEQG